MMKQCYWLSAALMSCYVGVVLWNVLAQWLKWSWAPRLGGLLEFALVLASVFMFVAAVLIQHDLPKQKELS